MPKNELPLPDGITPEERAVYLKVAKKFGLKIKKTIEPIPGATKIIKTESYCSLCETTVVKYIQMIKYTDGVWKKDKVVSEKTSRKVHKLDHHADLVSCCSCCFDFLYSKSKKELVKIIMRTRSPILTNKAVKKVLAEMREKEYKGEKDDS